MAEMPQPMKVEVTAAIMLEPSLDDFDFKHLLEREPFLGRTSRQFYGLAKWMLEHLPAGAQRAQGLWDLLRAKDCAVRAARDKMRALDEAEKNQE